MASSSLITKERIARAVECGKYIAIGRKKTSCFRNLKIEENGTLYPVEIKMSGNPKASMGATNQVLDKIPDKKRGMGIILCLIDKKTYLRENLIALPISYI